MITINDKKVTANEAAKYYVHYYGESAHTAFADDQTYGESSPSEREQQAVHDAICKQINRVAKFLGIDKFERKLRERA